MSEAELASTIEFYVNTVGEQVDKEFATHPAKYKNKMEVSLPNETHEVEFLGWLIIAAGEHYQGSDALKKALFRVKNEVGWQTPPHWVSWEEHREAIVKMFMQKPTDNLNSPNDDNPFIQTHLFGLANQAMERMTKRSGYKFEGYTGFELVGE